MTIPSEVRTSWVTAVRGLSADLVHRGLEEDFLFHGTSTKALKNIRATGFDPTDVSLAVPDFPGQFGGSFWGAATTALSYALDTSEERHPGSEPVIIAVKRASLEGECLLVPDLATLDFPIDGLTRLEEPGVRERWEENDYDLPWEDGLRDLGAIVALHDVPLSDEDFLVLDSPEHVIGFLENALKEVDHPAF